MMCSTRSRHRIEIKPESKILVVGLGKSGFAAVKFFTSLGTAVSVSESATLNTINPKMVEWLNENKIDFETGGHSVELFTSVDAILVSPGVPLDLPPLQTARHHLIPVMGEMAIGAQFLKTPVVAITGTNGKTTVTTLLGEIFKSSGMKVFVGGNIGTPLFDYLSGPQNADIAVLEVSSFQLDTAGGETGFRPNMSILLNISPDHLDRYESFSAYAASKFQIFSAQQEDDIAILNADDPEILNQKKLWPSKSKCYFFGSERKENPGAVLHGKNVLLSSEIFPEASQEGFDLSNTSLRESPNLQNGMAAILAARLMGCSEQAINKGITRFTPLAHRMTLIGEVDGVKYIDDSKATNIGAVQAALAGMDRNLILIAGGRDKGGDYNLLRSLIKEKVKTLLLIGEAKEKIAKAFSKITHIVFADSLQDSVYMASNLAEPGDTVLLSPACSSFDMFESYADRGDIFKEAVLNLVKKPVH